MIIIIMTNDSHFSLIITYLMTRPSISWRPFLSEATQSWESEVITQASVDAPYILVSENCQLIKDRFMNPIPVNVIHQPEKVLLHVILGQLKHIKKNY